VKKVHVSLPPDIWARISRRAAEHGVGFSTEVASIIRRELDSEDQAILDAALRLDAEENAAFAASVGVVEARTIGR
jgi:plasmid stability protein